MKKICSALFIAGLMVVSSCGDDGGSPQSRATSMCDCMKEAGLDGLDMDNVKTEAQKIDEKKQKKLAKCVAGVLKNVEKDMKGMKDKKAKSDYTRELMKGFIDSDCADKLFEGLPYSDAEKMLPEMIKALEKGEIPLGFGSEGSSSEAYESDEGWGESGTNDCGEYSVSGYYDEYGEEVEDCFGPGCDCR